MAVFDLTGNAIDTAYAVNSAELYKAYDRSGDEIFTKSQGVIVFAADFTGESPSPTQFYSWEGREFGAFTDSMSNIVCDNGVVDLMSYYDTTRAKWIRQMICTGGIFESDNFTLTFKAMFSGTAGSWQNVITYGTGTHWTNGTYSDGVKWPAGGEIDAFEQVGGYSENPNTFSPTFHYGSGTNSGYPNGHLFEKFTSGARLPVDQWADYRFELRNGIAKVYVNGTLVGQGNGTNLTVSNNYLWNYKPFLKPQAFYIDGQCANGSASIDASNVYHFYVKDFEISVDSDKEIPCTELQIYPQMWESGTSIVFPTNAEFYLEREYTPSDTSNKACTWSSSNPSVAFVCQGYVKTLSEGTCTITAVCGNASASYTFTVSNANKNVPCAGVMIDSSNLQLVESGSNDLSGSIYKFPRYTTNSIQLVSSDTSVVSVSDTTITGVNSGEATITARCGDAIATIQVSVFDGILFDGDIAINNSVKTISNVPIDYDGTQTYSFQYTFSSHSPVSSATTNNCIVGPVTSKNAARNGAIVWLASSESWAVYLGGSTKNIDPNAGDIVTIVRNFSSGKTFVYMNGELLYSYSSAGDSYFTDTAKIISNKDNALMSVAPVHIKIAIGDLH